MIDDLHWADKPTLLLLRHVISNPVPGLMVLCTYRDTDIDRSHPLSSMLADFRRMPAATRLAVLGLGDDAVRDLLVRMGGHDLDPAGLEFAAVVHRETSGNPFFVGEVLRHLAETGALVERDGRWTSSLRPEEAGIPEGIREVVGRRLSRLGDEVEEVLRAAAVIGYEFDVDLLADVVGRNADDVLDALDAARVASLVVEVVSIGIVSRMRWCVRPCMGSCRRVAAPDSTAKSQWRSRPDTSGISTRWSPLSRRTGPKPPPAAIPAGRSNSPHEPERKPPSAGHGRTRSAGTRASSN